MSRVARTLSRTPFQRAARLHARHRLATLCYHDVPDAERFRAHVDLISRSYNPVTLDHAIAAIRFGARLPRNAVLVTFDDADPTVLDIALPLMRDRSMPGVVFAIGDLVGARRPTWWAEVAELTASGATAPGLPEGDAQGALTRLKAMADTVRRDTIDALRRGAPDGAPTARQLTADELRELDHAGLSVQSHTLSHPLLPRCDEATIEREVHEAQEVLGEVLGRPPVALAYPNGLWDARSARTCARAGLEVCFQLDHRLTETPSANPYAVSRLRIGARDDPSVLSAVSSGLTPWVAHRLHGATAAPRPDVWLGPSAEHAVQGRADRNPPE